MAEADSAASELYPELYPGTAQHSDAQRYQWVMHQLGGDNIRLCRVTGSIAARAILFGRPCRTSLGGGRRAMPELIAGMVK